MTDSTSFQTLSRADRRRHMKHVRKSITRAVRVHEAGHTVARIWTAPALGWTPDEAVLHVELGPRADAIFQQGDMLLSSQGQSFGMFFSKPMDEFFRKDFPNGKPGEPGDDIGSAITPELFDRFRAAGLDLTVWLAARILFCVAGPVAESLYTETPIRDLLASPGHLQDKSDVMNAGRLARQEITDDIINEAIQKLIEHFSNPQIWQATLAIADILKMGTTPGQRIVSVFNSYVPRRI
jgi:hypothetical protein